ncbi:MAG: hypothetical protein H7Z39_14205 [Burkholderiaceae bacterium]|nr:hypothetical protein [Burkholderiaceae bacterium]
MKRHQAKLATCLVGMVIAAALSIPAVNSLTRASQTTGDNRVLAPKPTKPRSIDDLLKYPKQLEPWINDHFGFRDNLIELNNQLRHAFFGQFPTIQVISGRDGRIFLSSHGTSLPEYSAITIPCGVTPTAPERVAGLLNGLHQSFLREGIDARIMIVPSAPIIYPEALPAWLEARCRKAASPVESALASAQLEAQTLNAIYYPKTEMLALKERVAVFPKSWFHWGGAGPREVAGLSAEHFWKIRRLEGAAIAETLNRVPSDIGHLFPGVNLTSEVEFPDHPRSGIEACLGPKCFPSLGVAADKLQEMAFYRNAGAPHQRLIILSDSFGRYIASWYPRYFKEVIHFSTNSWTQLDAAEKRKFSAYIKEQAKIGHTLLLYHDGSTLWNSVPGGFGADQIN